MPQRCQNYLLASWADGGRKVNVLFSRRRGVKSTAAGSNPYSAGRAWLAPQAGLLGTLVIIQWLNYGKREKLNL